MRKGRKFLTQKSNIRIVCKTKRKIAYEIVTQTNVQTNTNTQTRNIQLFPLSLHLIVFLLFETNVYIRNSREFYCEVKGKQWEREGEGRGGGIGTPEKKEKDGEKLFVVHMISLVCEERRARPPPSDYKEVFLKNETVFSLSLSL